MSITHLECNIVDLESKLMLTTGNRQLAAHLLKRLDGYNTAFKEQHFIILDLIEGDDDQSDDQQRELDDHEDKVLNFAFRLEQLSHPSAPSPHTEVPVPAKPMGAEFTNPMAADSHQGLSR